MSKHAEIADHIVALSRKARFTGPLNADQITLGAHLSWSNAVSLLSEARLLAEQSRFARALSLTVIALEELAKPPLLWSLDPADDSAAWRAFWRAFSSHSPKQRAIGGYGHLLEGIGHGPYDLFMTDAVVNALDRIKQWGLYADCVDGSFQSPHSFSPEISAIVDFLFAIAEERADSFAQFHASVELSGRIYRKKGTSVVHGSLWPPPVGTEVEVSALLLSLASQYSRSHPPNYSAFNDACEQLAETAGGSMLADALTRVARQCYDRTICTALETSRQRAFLMMKLALMGLPEGQRKTLLKQWQQVAGV